MDTAITRYTWIVIYTVCWNNFTHLLNIFQCKQHQIHPTKSSVSSIELWYYCSNSTSSTCDCNSLRLRGQFCSQMKTLVSQKAVSLQFNLVSGEHLSKYWHSHSSNSWPSDREVCDTAKLCHPPKYHIPPCATLSSATRQRLGDRRVRLRSRGRFPRLSFDDVFLFLLFRWSGATCALPHTHARGWFTFFV